MVHRVGREARRGVAVAVAALNCSCRHVRRGRHAGCGLAVMAVRAVGIGCGVGKGAAGKAGVAAAHCLGVAAHAILAVGGDVTGIGGGAVGPLRSFGRIGAAVAGIATCAGHRGVVHRVGGEIAGGVGVTVAALDRPCRHMRRGRHAGRDLAVMAVRAVGVGCSVDKSAAGKAGKAVAHRLGVAGLAITAVGGDVAGIGGGAVGALRSLGRIGTVVTGIAARGGDRRVIHRVGREAARTIGVAIAALNPRHRDMRRGLHSGCAGAVVAVRAIGVARRVNVGAAGKADVAAARRRGVTGFAIITVGRDVPGVRGRAIGALRALGGIGAVVAGVAACPGHGRMAHGIGGEAGRGVGMAIAALDARHRDMRRRR